MTRKYSIFLIVRRSKVSIPKQRRIKIEQSIQTLFESRRCLDGRIRSQIPCLMSDKNVLPILPATIQLPILRKLLPYYDRLKQVWRGSLHLYARAFVPST